MLPAARILNSPLIHTNFYPGSSLHPGFDVSSSMTHESETTKPTWMISEVNGCVHVLSNIFFSSRVSDKK
uniref:Ovule protein n=1 Tax=Mesocestoides corti TaxID=53468 RepID=A0A5K3F9S3_MESCO